MDEYDALIARLKRGKRFLVASHYNPDGDGIGSTLALGTMLGQMGKEVVLYNRDGLPKNLAFLPSSDRIVKHIPKVSFDTTIMADCAKRKRISDEFAAFKGLGEVVCIDHHLFEEPEADFKLIDSDAASTGEVVLRLMRRAGVNISPDIAQYIYTTIVVDTGFFKYSNTTADILAIAADLVRAGAKPWIVAKNIEESYPVARYRLLGASLATLSVSLGGRFASMDVTQEMLKISGATMDLSDEFATFPRSIEGVEVSALFRENDDGRVKVSMRSKDIVDVAAIAQRFGGGGHAHAAGFQMKATMEEVKKMVDEAVARALLQSVGCET